MLHAFERETQIASLPSLLPSLLAPSLLAPSLPPSLPPSPTHNIDDGINLGAVLEHALDLQIAVM